MCTRSLPRAFHGRRARVLEARADDGHRHRAALVRLAVRRVEHDRRRVVHRLHELDDVVVGRRRLVVGGLGRGLQIRERRWLLRAAGDDERCSEDGNQHELPRHDQFSFAGHPTISVIMTGPWELCRRVLFVALVLGAVAAGAGCGGSAPTPVTSAARPSILLVTLDTTRFDAIGPDAAGVETPAFNASSREDAGTCRRMRRSPRRCRRTRR